MKTTKKLDHLGLYLVAASAGGSLLMAGSLVYTASTLAESMAATGTPEAVGWVMGGSFDLLAAIGLVGLPYGLRVRGMTLKVTAALAAMGALGSIGLLLFLGHAPWTATFPAVAAVLLAASGVLRTVMPSAETVKRITEKQDADRDRAAEDADDRRRTDAAVVAALTSDVTTLAARQAALLKVQAKTAQQLSSATKRHGDASKKLAALSADMPQLPHLPADGFTTVVPQLPAGAVTDADVADDVPPVDDVPSVDDVAADVVDAELARALADSDWLDVAVAVGAAGKTVPADQTKAVVVAIPSGESSQVAKGIPTLPSALASKGANDAATRAARVAEVKRDGLDARQAADRFGVHIKTARGYVRDAAQQG